MAAASATTAVLSASGAAASGAAASGATGSRSAELGSAASADAAICMASGRVSGDDASCFEKVLARHTGAGVVGGRVGAEKHR